jgi:hypothetical protein
MSSVQKQLKTVTRNKTVEVESKDGRTKWDSKYVTLDKLYEAAHPILSAAGVTMYQGGGYVNPGGERVFTRLAFEGEWIESDFPVKPRGDGAQSFGGGASFARRWGLCYMLGLVASGDDDEATGYKDNRPVKAQRAKVTAGLAERVSGIGSATSVDDLARRAIEARSLHPLPDEATAVERAVSTRFVQAFGDARSLDELTLLRDACNKVKPRGNEVREAIRSAEVRLTNGQP